MQQFTKYIKLFLRFAFSLGLALGVWVFLFAAFFFPEQLAYIILSLLLLMLGWWILFKSDFKDSLQLAAMDAVVTFLEFVAALVISGIAGIAIIVMGVVADDQNLPPYAIALLISVVPALLLIVLIRSELSRSFLVCAFAPTTALATLVLVFAFIYFKFGLVDGGQNVHNLRTSFYFSVITWTTVGYGDVQPTPETRPVAAIQSLAGYVFMALTLALWIQKKNKRGIHIDFD